MTSPRVSWRPRATTVFAAIAVMGLLILAASPARAQDNAPTTDGDVTTTVDQSLTTTPPLDTGEAPAGASPDLDMDRITGPRHVDGKVTSTTFWPLGIAAVGILLVFGTIFYRAARGNRSTKRSHP